MKMEQIMNEVLNANKESDEENNDLGERERK